MDQLKAREKSFNARAFVSEKGMDKNTVSNAIKKAFFCGHSLCFSQPALETTLNQANFA